LDILSNNLNISINARIVEGLPYDIIIGLPTVRKYKLTRHFRELVEESEKSDPNIILNPTMLYLRDPVSKRVELRHSSFLNGLSEVHNWGELQNDGFFDAPAKEI
jgi:hypothetical protein